MFDFKNSNAAQREAITSTDGPLLITAGPGTGKTYTLVQRALFLIEEKGVKPKEILIATFTEKAAKEITTRLTDAFYRHNVNVNLNDMYIGTFHSICLRIIKENLDFSRLAKNYRLLDSFDQQYLVYNNIHHFKAIDGFAEVITNRGYWQMAERTCYYVNIIAEEMVDLERLAASEAGEIRTLAAIVEKYRVIAAEENLLDFSTIQTECYRLLKENSAVLAKLREKIRFLMIDEYQDTNYVQEQLVFLIGGDRQNICVVGDDAQGLYRFRGATIRNILEFSRRFEAGKCKTVSLTVNYRSHPDIVNLYNQWMADTAGHNFRFDWGKFRLSKEITPAAKKIKKSPAAVLLRVNTGEAAPWHEKICKFIKQLTDSGKVTNLNQIAFLFRSVKHRRITALAAYLEEHGIAVYSPRSDLFFTRDEVRIAIGCLLLTFRAYVQDLESADGFKALQPQHTAYYKGCMKAVTDLIQSEECAPLKVFLQQRFLEHNDLYGDDRKTTDYAFTGLLYQLFSFEPFKRILNTPLDTGTLSQREVRNLAQLTQIAGKFEYINRISVFNGKYLKKDVESFFNRFLRLLFDEGVGEYEDEAEYAPSGCVSFLTVHQAKGLEFPIVFVGSLWSVPREQGDAITRAIEKDYFHRPPFEPQAQTKFFDFWRLFYTAYSRAQNLLVLTSTEDSKNPSKYFSEIYPGLPCVGSEPEEKAAGFSISDFDFQSVKGVELKDTFSFTSHIAVYESCARQYKFYKELAFLPVRENAMIFGTLVHQTIEDIHRAALRAEEQTINEGNIRRWFEGNYSSLVKSHHTYLAQPQKEAALTQVLRYAGKQSGQWGAIKEAEVDVSLVCPDYIITGKIDLVRGADGQTELVDFKSERKPDMLRDRERIEYYRRQLHIYAHILEQRTGEKISRMNIYYTGEESGSPIISFPYTKTAIEGTMASFDDAVHKILKKDFNHTAEKAKTCEDCDFRHFCHPALAVTKKYGKRGARK